MPVHLFGPVKTNIDPDKPAEMVPRLREIALPCELRFRDRSATPTRSTGWITNRPDYRTRKAEISDDVQ